MKESLKKSSGLREQLVCYIRFVEVVILDYNYTNLVLTNFYN